MRTLRSTFLFGMLAAASALLVGCASLRSAPPLPLQVVFAGSAPFTIESAPAAVASEEAAVRCRVRRAEVLLTQVRGDTVFFAGVVSHEPARGQPRCSFEGPGLIALADQPQVRSETVRSSPGLSLLAMLAIVPAVVGLTAVITILTGGLDLGT